MVITVTPMAKFNVVQKQRRALQAERKRAIHGEPSTRKLKTRKQSIPISGKRKRKLLKKSRREQKEAMKLGLESMEGVEVAAPQGATKESDKIATKFHVKKSVKIKQLKLRDKKQKRKGSSTGSEAAVDVMVE